MKKVVSLLVALAAALGVNATVFAAQDDISMDGGTVRRMAPYSSNEIAGVTGDSGNMGSNANGSNAGINNGTNQIAGVAGNSGNMGSNARINYGTSGTSVTLAQDEILLVTNSSTSQSIILPEAKLEPGTEYTFKIYKSDIAQTNVDSTTATLSPITESMLSGGKFKLRGKGGTSSIDKAEVKKKGTGPNATYVMEITTKETWGTKTNDVEYAISVSGQKDGANAVNFAESNSTFEVGYQSMSDDDIDSFDEGDTLTIPQDTPVITKEQFQTLSKNANYKAIDFEDENGAWTFLGRVSGMASSNFKFTRDVIPEIVQKFEDQDFEFLTFGAGVTFPTNGEMRLDVSDFSNDFSRIYSYLYRDGKLTPVTTTYDSGADELVFRTNFLGSFVMTDEQITDTTILNNTDNTDSSTDSSTDTEAPTPDNPSTGASNGFAVAVALGLASVAAISTTRKK